MDWLYAYIHADSRVRPLRSMCASRLCVQINAEEWLGMVTMKPAGM